MSADLRGFDASQHDEMIQFDPIPNGKYTAIVIASELKDTKTGNGQGLNLTFQIVDGEFRGRQLFTWINLRHSNTETVRIASMELAAICKAVGVLTPKNSDDLHDKPILITLKQEVRKDNGAIQNKICGYAPRAKYSAEASGPQEAPEIMTSGKSPWSR